MNDINNESGMNPPSADYNAEGFDSEYSRRWEDEASFNDVLAEQIRKAPYLLTSLLVHAILAFIISGWILLTSSSSEAPTITVQAPPPPPEIEEEEPPEEEIIEEVVEEPVLQERYLKVPSDRNCPIQEFPWQVGSQVQVRKIHPLALHEPSIQPFSPIYQKRHR